METLISADGCFTRLSGSIEILCSYSGASTIIESHPGIGIPIQRVCLDGLRILHVETLIPEPRPKVTVEKLPTMVWIYWRTPNGCEGHGEVAIERRFAEEYIAKMVGDGITYWLAEENS